MMKNDQKKVSNGTSSVHMVKIQMGFLLTGRDANNTAIINKKNQRVHTSFLFEFKEVRLPRIQKVGKRTGL